MSVYLIAQINIEDRDAYSRYESGFSDIFSRYGGTILSVDEAPETLEGSWVYTRTVLLEFPSESKALSWYHSPEYQDLARHRLASSSANIAMVKGLGRL